MERLESKPTNETGFWDQRAAVLIQITTAVNPMAITAISASINPKNLSDSMRLSRLAPFVPVSCLPAQTGVKLLCLTTQELFNRV